jgi:putative NADPH-quinone reductase
MKKILIIQGHPDRESFCHAISRSYKLGALSSGAEVKEINVADLKFNPTLPYGYKKKMAMEDCLLKSQALITWAEHLVFVYPTWWGTMPALLKGFIDRVFLPEFAFKYRTDSVWWDKLLCGRSARLIVTMDSPAWYYRLVQGMPGHNAMKKVTLEFCGIKPVRISSFGSIKNSKIERRTKWLASAEKLGKMNI